MNLIKSIALTTGSFLSGQGILYPIITPTGRIYVFFIDTSNSDPSYVYSDNYGFTWSSPVAFKSCTTVSMSVWYDRWSGINADLAHVVYTDSSSDDTFYRTLDCSNNTLGTERTVFAGASTTSAGVLSVTRARGGNIMVVTCIDDTTEYDTRKSTNLGVNWTSTTTDVYEAGSTDQLCLIPGWNADNQDVMAIFWDSSADEISVKRYDDSADTWTETSISTGMVESVSGTTTGFPHFAISVDLANSRNVLIAWTAVDTANADLKCWTIDDTTITGKTDVVLNSTDDQGLAAISIKDTTWTVYYVGKSDGSHSFNSDIAIYYKTSTNGGTTWSSEQELISNFKDNIVSIFVPIINNNNQFITYYRNAYSVNCIVSSLTPRVTYQLGI